MARRSEERPALPTFGGGAWKRWLAVIGFCVVAVTVLWLVAVYAFFVNVPAGKVLVVIAKSGEPLDPGHVLARPGQQGIQREVLGEGWHFVTPIVYETEVKDLTVVPAGKAGIVTNLGGNDPPAGRVLANSEDEKGIRRQVLLPGAYRLNPHGFKVELVDATEIKPGHVGVLRRRLGKPNTERFARSDDEQGLVRDILQPGLYFLNTKEFEVIHGEVGIDQTTYRADSNPAKNTAIKFPAKDGNEISMECTIEWEVMPQDVPEVVAEYGSWEAIESNVIDQQAKRIGRDRGFNYGAQDFLEGEKREKFQQDFTAELERVCKENKVVVRSAFIRNIIIPDKFLKPKRDQQLAAETKITNEMKQITEKTKADVQDEQSKIGQRLAEVQAETDRLVAAVEVEVANLQTKTTAEIDRMKADYNAKMAQLDAERKRVLGKAEAEAKQMVETARNSLYKLKMDVFKGDGNAYLRYAMAQELNPQIVLRLFHAGPGTLWTNMDGKQMNLMVPAPGAPPAPAKPATPMAPGN